MSKFGDKPLVVSLYSNAAARAYEPFGKETGEITYETSLAQVRESGLGDTGGQQELPIHSRGIVCSVFLKWFPSHSTGNGSRARCLMLCPLDLSVLRQLLIPYMEHDSIRVAIVFLAQSAVPSHRRFLRFCI